MLPLGAKLKDMLNVPTKRTKKNSCTVQKWWPRYVSKPAAICHPPRQYLCPQIRDLEALFTEVDEFFSLKKALIDSNFAQFSAEKAAAAAAAEEERVAKLKEEDQQREMQRLELARQKQRTSEQEAQAAAKAAAIAEQQSRALAAARAEKEAARAAEEAEYKAKQRRLAAEREAQEAQRMIQQKEEQAAAARSVLESRSQGGSGLLQAAGLQVGIVNEAHSLQQLDAFIQTTKATGMPCIVDYFAPWCGPCVQFAPAYQAAASQYRDIVFIKVNCDNAPGVSASKGIRAFPTFHSYVRGTLRQSWSGASMPKLQAALADASQAEEEAALRDAVAMSNGADAMATGGSASPSSPSRHGGPPEYSIVPGLMSERPMGQLLQRFAQSVNREDFASACKLLRAYVKNTTEPGKKDDPKYRTVQKSNAAYTQRLGRHGDMADELMKCAGFQPSGSAWELPMGDLDAEAAALNARPVLEAAARQAADVAPAAVPRPAPAPAPQPSTGGGGLGGLANAFGGGAGGMAGLLQNPDIMRAAQQMMGGGGMDPSMLARLAQNPQMANMAQQMMRNPQALQQAQQMMGNPQAAAQLQQMMGGAVPPGVPPATAPAPAPAPAPTPAPAPAAAAPAPAPSAAPNAPTTARPTAAAAAAGGSDVPGTAHDSDEELEAALRDSMFGDDPDGV